MLYVIMGAMLVAAAAFAAVPLVRHGRQLSATSLVVVATLALSAGLYAAIGSPGVNSGRTAVPSISDMVASLENRLRQTPNDVNGWKMLGRSKMELGDLPGAITAFEKAVALEDGRNGATLISLGEAILVQDRSTMAGRAGQLFESGLALEPNNPQGLFFGGLAALQRGDQSLAADRWEALIAMSPPDDVRDILAQRVAEWRGEAPPAVAPVAEAAPPVVSIDISLSDAAAAAVSPADTVFIIARDPAQPSPPIAVARRRAADLPATVTLSDSDAMMPARLPSAHDELELVVRVSSSGQPMARSGDWYGSMRVLPAEEASVAVLVDKQEP